FTNLWKTISEGRVWTGRIINKQKDGSIVETEQTISPVRDAAGQIVNFLSVAQDVTRTVQMEAELRQSQKMESVGRLAGGIAHDFNNLLTAILGFARLIRGELGESHPADADVQEIVNAGERAAKLTKQLLAFGRKQLLQMHPLDLNAIVINMDQILRRTLGEDIELVTMCSEGMGSVEADAGLLEQVVMNLAVNARDAMPKGGKLTITTSRIQLDEDYCERHVGVKPGDYALLSVRDVGNGMTEHVREHAFEPFFTTKEKGKGTGLGLSTVYGIVKQCHGHIELISSPGQGAEFKIYFPRATAEPQKIIPSAETPVPRGTENILVVEDESTVRRLTRRNLEALGYSVLEARHGEDALRVYQTNAGSIHLVLTDVVMPCMGGPELVERLRALNPKVKVLYMSGFTEDVMLDRVHVEHAASLILKPFTLETLSHSIRQALDGA
ncbi:MAG TPA: ATP-binding protein, partial [Kiritimatiellia bacterium]